VIGLRHVVIALAMSGCCMSGSDPVRPPPAPSIAPPAPEVIPDLVVDAPPITIHVPALPRYAFEVERAGEYAIDADGTPMSAQLRLFSGSDVVMQAGGGASAGARIVTFLAPGTYEAQIGEWRSRELDAHVSLTRLPPLPPVATLAPGDAAASVQCPHAETSREASVELTLVITTPATYRIDARSSDALRDPELALLEDGGLLQADSDSGDGNAAQIVRELAPGSYTLRLRDWLNRNASIAVEVTPEPS
jgi:hypothetical protein